MKVEDDYITLVKKYNRECCRNTIVAWVITVLLLTGIIFLIIKIFQWIQK